MPITPRYKRNTCVYKMTDVPTFLRHVLILIHIHMCVKADHLILTQIEQASYSSILVMFTFTLTK
jgi:hypothetical protein